jgi:hypothetical protein
MNQRMKSITRRGSFLFRPTVQEMFQPVRNKMVNYHGHKDPVRRVQSTHLSTLLRQTLVLLSSPSLGVLNGIFLSDFPVIILYAFLNSIRRVMWYLCHIHRSLKYFHLKAMHPLKEIRVHTNSWSQITWTITSVFWFQSRSWKNSHHVSVDLTHVLVARASLFYIYVIKSEGTQE